MRVITGAARGKRLETLPGNDVRPTPEKVKEGIFSAIQFDIEGRRFLDLFAGSGQMGIEALSRGAESAAFVDSAPAHLEVVRRNVGAAGFDKSARIIRSDFASYLATTQDTFDIAFLDPPYYAGILEKALEGVCRVMSEAGIILCEHPDDVELPESIAGFRRVKSYGYGKITVCAYRRDICHE